METEEESGHVALSFESPNASPKLAEARAVAVEGSSDSFQTAKSEDRSLRTPGSFMSAPSNQVQPSILLHWHILQYMFPYDVVADSKLYIQCFGSSTFRTGSCI